MIALLVSAVALISPLTSYRVADLGPSVVCKPVGALQTSSPASPALLYRHGDPGAVKRLDTLPKANHEKAVLRTVGGCSRPMVVGYEVEGDGRFAAPPVGSGK